MARLNQLPAEVWQEYCLLRARNVSIRRASRILAERYAGDPEVEIPNFRTFARWDKSPERREATEIAQKELLAQARSRGHALHGLRVDALDDQIQVLRERAEGEDDPKLLVELFREIRLALAEMNRQMEPFERHAAAKDRSPAESFMNSDKDTSWKKGQPDSSGTPTN